MHDLQSLCINNIRIPSCINLNIKLMNAETPKKTIAPVSKNVDAVNRVKHNVSITKRKECACINICIRWLTETDLLPVIPFTGLFVNLCITSKYMEGPKPNEIDIGHMYIPNSNQEFVYQLIEAPTESNIIANTITKAHPIKSEINCVTPIITNSNKILRKVESEKLNYFQ